MEQTIRKPQVGDTVLFTPNPDDSIAKSNHNDGEVAAIITRVWSDVCCNIKIIPDCGAMQDRTSVVHQSANPVGYHFRFRDEDHKRVLPNLPDGTVQDSKLGL